jgi:hypothetical protein
MGKLRRPELLSGPLDDLVRELHALHARAGRPSMRELAKGQGFSYTTVHVLFTKTIIEPPRLPVLHKVVERLATLAPRANVEEILDKFDALWRAADDKPFAEPSGERSAPAKLKVKDCKTTRQRFVAELNRVLERKHQTTSFRQWGIQAGVAHRTIRTLLIGERIPIDATLLSILKAADVSDNDIKRLRADASRLRADRGMHSTDSPLEASS